MFTSPTQEPASLNDTSAHPSRRREGKQRETQRTAHLDDPTDISSSTSTTKLPAANSATNNAPLPTPSSALRSRSGRKSARTDGEEHITASGAGLGGARVGIAAGPPSPSDAGPSTGRRSSTFHPTNSPSVGVRRERAFSIDGTPVAPPSLGADEDDESWEKSVRESNQFTGWHYLPLIFAIVPPIGAVIHGRAESWSDSLVLLITAFYLYQIVRVPWELYYASRTRRILSLDAVPSDDTPEARARRRTVIAELNVYEIISLATTVLAPFLGAWLLYWMRFALSDPDRFINPISIRLFILACGIKPWSHFFSLLRRRSLFLQEEVHYPSSTVVVLQSRIASLEKALLEVKDVVATKTDMVALRDGLDAPLSHLQKALRRTERKEEYGRMSNEEKFAVLEAKLTDTLRDVAINAELIEQLKDENDRATSLNTFLRVVNHLIGGSTSSKNAAPSQQGKVEGTKPAPQLRWYEKGPFFYTFLPLNMSTMALGYAGKGAEKLMKRVESKDQEQQALIGANKTRFNGAEAGGGVGALESEDELPGRAHGIGSKLATVRGTRNR